MCPRLASLVLLTAAAANALAAPSTMSKRAGPRLDLPLQSSDAPDAERTCGPPIYLNMVSGPEYEPAIQAAIDAALDDDNGSYVEAARGGVHFARAFAPIDERAGGGAAVLPCR